MTDEIEPQSVKDWNAKSLAHLKRAEAHLERAEAMLTFCDNEYDKSVAIIQNPPTGELNRLVILSVICYQKLAPIADIKTHLDSGGIVIADIAQGLKYPASQVAMQKAIKRARILSCNDKEAEVVWLDTPNTPRGDNTILRNPAQAIVGCLFIGVGG